MSGLCLLSKMGGEAPGLGDSARPTSLTKSLACLIGHFGPRVVVIGATTTHT